MLNGSEGWEIPRQPRLNSSINFTMGSSLHVISKSKIWPGSKQNGHFQPETPAARPSRPACLVPGVQE
jgi:hypothetical protein